MTFNDFINDYIINNMITTLVSLTSKMSKQEILESSIHFEICRLILYYGDINAVPNFEIESIKSKMLELEKNCKSKSRN